MSKCAVCRTEYKKLRMSQKVCGAIECAVEQGRRETIKAQRKAERLERAGIRDRLISLKTRSQWMKEAQAAVNAYVRERDAGLPCISCGITHPKQWHAGHFLSRGAHPELALEPRNIFRQCSQCNDYLSGNQIEMRKGIVARKGQAEVDWLEGPHETKKYTIDNLKSIRDEYRAKLKELKSTERMAA